MEYSDHPRRAENSAVDVLSVRLDHCKKVLSYTIYGGSITMVKDIEDLPDQLSRYDRR